MLWCPLCISWEDLLHRLFHIKDSSLIFVVFFLDDDRPAHKKKWENKKLQKLRASVSSRAAKNNAIRWEFPSSILGLAFYELQYKVDDCCFLWMIVIVLFYLSHSWDRHTCSFFFACLYAHCLLSRQHYYYWPLNLSATIIIWQSLVRNSVCCDFVHFLILKIVWNDYLAKNWCEVNRMWISCEENNFLENAILILWSSTNKELCKVKSEFFLETIKKNSSNARQTFVFVLKKLHFRLALYLYVVWSFKNLTQMGSNETF